MNQSNNWNIEPFILKYGITVLFHPATTKHRFANDRPEKGVPQPHDIYTYG